MLYVVLESTRYFTQNFQCHSPYHNQIFLCVHLKEWWSNKLHSWRLNFLFFFFLLVVKWSFIEIFFFVVLQQKKDSQLSTNFVTLAAYYGKFSIFERHQNMSFSLHHRIDLWHFSTWACSTYIFIFQNLLSVGFIVQ